MVNGLSFPDWRLGVGRWAFGVLPFPFLASSRPTRRHFCARRRVLVLTGPRWAFIQNHCDVAAERGLNFHRNFRRNKSRRPINMILEMHALLGNLAQLRQRENLVTATVGQNR